MVLKNYDLSYLRQITRGKEEPFYRIIRLFTKDTPLLLNQALEELHAGRYNNLRRVFHKMKNSVGLFMAQDLVNQLKYLENLCSEIKPSREKICGTFLQIRRSMLNLVFELAGKTTPEGVKD